MLFGMSKGNSMSETKRNKKTNSRGLAATAFMSKENSEELIRIGPVLEKKPSDFLTLSEAANGSKYTRAYISFAVRAGRMKGEKINGKWHTKKEWLEEFTRKAEMKNEEVKTNLSQQIKTKPGEKFLKFAREWIGVAGSISSIAALIAVMIIFFQIGKNKYEKEDNEKVAGTVTLRQGGKEYQAADLREERAGIVLAETTEKESRPTDLDVSAYLLGADNKEISNGGYEVRFALYSANRKEPDPHPSDTDKSQRIWEETKTVSIENGLLKTFLGSETPIPDSVNFAEENYYLGVRIGEDSEMVPRKKIGAVPVSKVAARALKADSISGYTVGSASGNIPVSSGTLNANLNADMLDGKQAGAFQLAGESSYTPEFGSSADTIAEGNAALTISTTGNLQGGGSGTSGEGISLTLDTVSNPSFSSLTITGDASLAAATNLVFGGTTSLGETTSATDSGAYMVGVFDEFTNSDAANVQGVLKDLDTAMGGGVMWSLSGGIIYSTADTNDFAVGGTTLAASVFGIDESAGNFYFGYDNSANPTFLFEATDDNAGSLGFNTNDAFYFSDANVGIGTTNPLALLSVGATSQLQVNSSGAISAATGITSSGNITFSGLSPDAGETTGILLNGANQLVSREFGTLAFSSAAYDNYQYWELQANGAAGQNITSTGAASFNGAGIVTTSRAGSTLTITGTEADTLSSVIGRGATTTDQLVFNYNSGAPFTVLNNTVVTNLNADYLDGQHGAYYASASSISGTDNYIPRFNGTSALENSIIYDTGTNVGIGTSAPNEALSISGALSLAEYANVSSVSATASYGKIFATGSGIGGNDSYTKLLLHNEGSGIAFVDSSQAAHAVTANGNATQSTAQYKFGAKSAYFDGSGDYLYSPISDDWDIGTGDFTIDTWVYNTQAINNSVNDIRTMAAAGVCDANGHQCWIFMYGHSSAWGTNTRIMMGHSIGYGAGNWVGYYSSEVTISPNTWYHIAVVRSAGVITLYLNGTNVGSSASTRDMQTTDVGLYVGAYNTNSSIGAYHYGYLDELRYSKGIARWTSDFTPPASEYTSSSDRNLVFKDSADNNFILNNWWSNASSIYYLSGNVGIGTTSPSTALTVNGVTTSTGYIGSYIKPASDSATAFQIQKSDGTNVLNVDTSAGRVGIGTTAPGAQLDVSDTSITTGKSVNIASTGTGLTSGSLLYVSSATTGAVATNGIVSINATGNYSSTSNLIGALSVLANSTTAGTVANITGNALTTGQGLRLASTGTGLTSGSLLYVSSATTGAVATNGIVSINASGAYTSTSDAGLLNVTANSTLTGTIANMAGNALTSGKILNLSSSSAAFTGTLANITLSGNNAANTGTLLKVSSTGVSNTGVPLMVTNAGAGLSLRVNDDGNDTDTTPFVINATGNVGIGTTAPGNKLTISGGVGIGTTAPGSLYLSTAAPEGE